MKISQQAWMKYAKHLRIELKQAEEEGKDIEGLEAEIADIQALDEHDPAREARAIRLLDRTERLPVREGFPYAEPSDLEAIRAERPMRRPSPLPAPSDERLRDKLYGAWLGRSAGCLLGKPIEGWKQDRLTGFLRDTDNYPAAAYLSSDVPGVIKEKYQVGDAIPGYGVHKLSWINNVSHMVEDDDMNYTIISLAVMERFGFDFAPDDVADAWLMNLPFLHTFTAERVAYKNLLNGIDPPRSAMHRNMYREWIGAQIRADFFGYVNPGNTELAAELAWRDASVSHAKNGIYGAMWVAAMLAAAAATDDLEDIVRAGLGEIPERSRLSEAILAVLDWKREGIDWEQAIQRIHERFDDHDPHDWCHAISNAMIVAFGLLFGEGDFERSIGLAVTAAFDTDCNGATVGSIVGMIQGAAALPSRWIAPLNDTIQSGVGGFAVIRLSELADRTAALAKANPYLSPR
jgi:ADP-ribosylglycohydrolase